MQNEILTNFYSMGNLINTIGDKVRQSYEWLKSKAKSICDKIHTWYERYERYRERLKQHREYLDSVLDSSLEYTPENVDIELRDRLAEVLGKIEGGKLFEYIKSLSFEERKEYFEKTLLPLICKEMKVSPRFLGWFQDNATVGFYKEADQGIALNELFLTTDNDYVLRTIINTVIHECKHAMQWDAVSGRNAHGYSQELIEIWKRNFEDYISPEESDEGYVKQPVEWDASAFAESVYPTDKK